jgi:putative transposase
MARPLRLEYAGAVYHVMTRGHERGSVFRDDKDRERFLDIVGAVCLEQGWVVHGYCLMGNHFHLLVETPRGDLSAGMRSINGRYAQFFNRRHDRRGHLFEGRFRAILVQKDEHLLELCRYVVLNPVRARLVDRPEQWPWSSYRATAGLGQGPDWLAVDWTLSMFARGRMTGWLRFRGFVRAGRAAPSPLESVEGQLYLGDKGFVEGMREKAADWAEVDEIPLAQRRPRTVSVAAIRTLVAREWETSSKALSRRRGGEEKIAAMYLARKLSGLPVLQIAREFGVKPARVSNAVTDVERSPARRTLRERVHRLRTELSALPPAQIANV